MNHDERVMKKRCVGQLRTAIALVDSDPVAAIGVMSAVAITLTRLTGGDKSDLIEVIEDGFNHLENG